MERDKPNIREGKVSFYGKDFKKEHLNEKTASGEIFDPDMDTLALPDNRDFGKKYKVTNKANNKSVIVKHNDIGPNKRLNRAGDLSYAAFKKIADEKTGLIDATIEPYEDEPAKEPPKVETELHDEVMSQAGVDDDLAFPQAFAKHRKSGAKEFIWKNKKYTTKWK